MGAPAGERRVQAALTELGISAIDCAPVAGAAPWSRRPRTFRVTTADGELKVRLMRHQHRAARVEAITEALTDPRVPALVGRVGATTVERWVQGYVVRSGVVNGAVVDAAADILATVHCFGGFGRERLPRQQRLGSTAATSRAQLDELAAAWTISRLDAAALAEILDALPIAAPWGLIHTDFGGDNLVVRGDGIVVSIDNEHLVRGFLDFDLGRAWYRWPMSARSWRRFVGRYEAAVDRRVVADELRAWRAVATITGVHRRHRLAVPMTGALARLRALLDE